MALIKCPECGNQISDKATICPNCGCDPQIVLAEIREKQRQEQKKRRKRIIISITSILVVGAVAVLAYLYSIDGLNNIPAEYRKATNDYFERCESAISKGDFDKGAGFLDALKKRNLTNRQAKRFEEMRKVLLEKGLNGLENTLAAITNNYEFKSMERAKKEIAILNTYQLDASQTERLSLATNKYVELQLGEIEKAINSYKANTQISSYFEKTNRLAQELQGMKLSTAQKTRLEDAVKEAERIKRQDEEAQYRRRQLLNTIRDEYVRIVDSNNDYGSSYFLFDITSDKVPELWVKTGTCEADYQLLAYTYHDGIKPIYEGNAGHTSFYIGDGYIISLYAQMGYATWDKLTYNGKRIVAKTVFQEDISGTDRDYREPDEQEVSFYPYYDKTPIMNAF